MTKTKDKKFKPKNISNPYSTGGIGQNFENSVQASFVVLLLTKGIFPALSSYPIIKIELQNRIRRVNTDDLTVYTGNNSGEIYNKMFVQIKRDITIKFSNKAFKETIENAWLDFKSSLFNKEKDKIALITTPLSKTDNTCIKTLLDFADGAENSNEFLLKLTTKGYCHAQTNNKLEDIKKIIKHANNDEEVSDKDILEFLKIFHVFIYDIDIKGVTSALLRTIIEQFDGKNSSSTWCEIKEYVAEKNQKASTITLETISENIKKNFRNRRGYSIPADLVPIQQVDNGIYTNPKYKKALAFAGLIGTWSEININDKLVISSIINQDYEDWIKILQEIEQQNDSPVYYKKGIWTIKDRKNVLINTKSAIYDIDIERLQTETIKVLTEIDPKYYLEKNKRFYAYTYDNGYKYSYNIQKGLSETVALLGCGDYKFDHAENKLNYFADNVLYAIFKQPSWQHIATLNECIPILAEGAPSAFIKIINSICNKNSIIMKQLVEEEGDGITGGCYISGLLWALERLAWSPLYLIDVILLLGKLAEIMPNSRWSNNPENSIIEILMPWHYQTLASIKLQETATTRLLKEHSDIATQVLIKLLPTEHQIACDTNRPNYMNIFKKDWEYSVKINDRNELVSHYITLLIKQTKENIGNITLIIKNLNKLNDKDFEKVVKIISSKKLINATEEKRVPIWEALLSEIKKHKKFKNAKWAMSPVRLEKLEVVLDLIKPKDLINNIAPLFDIELNYDLEDENDNYEKVERKLNLRRKRALLSLLKQQPNFRTIIDLVNKVESPFMVSNALIDTDEYNFDNDIYPQFLKIEDRKIREFTYNYTFYKYKKLGLKWLEQIPYQKWENDEQVEFFKQLPSVSEIWNIINKQSQNIKASYWKTVDINPYMSDSDIDLINCLLKYNRPIAASECISKMLYNGQTVESSLIIKVLSHILKTNEDIRRIDIYKIGEMIKELQEDKTVDFEELASLEWKFYYALDNITTPKTLKQKLKQQPEFFCDLISIIYKPMDENLAKTEPIFEQKIISQAWTVLNEIKPLAGYDESLGTFDSKQFLKWFKKVIKIAKEKTRLEVTLNEIGQILFYTPADISGFWINKDIAEILNTEEYEDMRKGYGSEIINSRGVHTVDPTAKPELDLAAKYHKQAEDCRLSGFNRLATILDEAEEFYKREAKRILENRDE